MTLDDYLRRLTALLEGAAVPYMLTGSFASSFHGAPRTTQDVDLVIDTDREGVRRLIAALPPDDYYADESAALDALRRRSQFNVIDLATGWKADLIFRKGRPFSRTEFERRQVVDHAGMRLWMASPEDVVLSKLEWARDAGSERQLRDARGILDAKGSDLDRAYVARWAEDLGLVVEWERVQRG